MPSSRNGKSILTVSERFDPLASHHCQGQPLAQSYWSDTISLPQVSPPPSDNSHFDVAIIGGGFSGLLTAYYLATHYNQSVCVLEANQVGFGASARNAGFVLKGSGRMSYPDIAKKWGMDTCHAIHTEFSDAVKRVRQLIDEHNIDCDKQHDGYLKIAHNSKANQNLLAQAQFLKTLGAQADYLSCSELDSHFMHNRQAYGALRLPDSFGVNPLKLLLGYKNMAEKAGVSLFEHSLVSHIDEGPDCHSLKVNQSITVTANKIAITGNAYNNKNTHALINNRYLPILSSVFVTRPLNAIELEICGLKTHQVTMDTRTLKYYYRLLPDKRLLFGGRGAVFAKDQHKPVYINNLKKGLRQCFPILKNIQHDYYWSGYIAAALDDIPHVYVKNNIGYILGYCGSGVAFSAQASFRLAQMLCDDTVPSIPLYTAPLPKFPFAQFRRFGQLAYYQYAQVKDALF